VTASAGPAAVHEPAPDPPTWVADNGNGTYSNPIFYDEFSDPDMIRVGDDFYLTGTTMHSMPGLPILHSRDLVNWRFVAYAAPELDLGPEYRLVGGEIYGQGLWAPSFRYHDGTFHIFSNVNGRTTQLFRAPSPSGPWTRTPMRRAFHDLSVLFEGGKAYVVWGYRSIRMAELDATLTDIVPGTEREIIAESAGMGEGLHFFRARGKYWITSAWWDGAMRMPVARADRLDGPWEVNRDISVGEAFGLWEGHRLSGDRPPYDISAPNRVERGRMSLHQGGFIETPAGDWWGYSMMDYNSVGRLTALSPVAWQDGWPYFGLSGNLGRTPRTWVKPNVGSAGRAVAPYRRSDDFSGSSLQPVWQWNHMPVRAKWSLTERPDHLRLHTMPADGFWTARNSLTQRAIGPRSTVRIRLDASGLRPGDAAGLGLLSRPFATIGVERTQSGLELVQFDEQTGASRRAAASSNQLWLQADADFLAETARLSYSFDGREFVPLGEPFTMVFQLKTFQGVRYALYAYNREGRQGGHVDFDEVQMHEPSPRGLTRPIPCGETIRLVRWGRSDGITADGTGATLGAPSPFTAVDRSLGRIALRGEDGRFLSVRPGGSVHLVELGTGEAETFQWIETPEGQLTLMALTTHRYLSVDPDTGQVRATHPGPSADPQDGVRFTLPATRRSGRCSAE
jgi:xylan 1,4-beta-xylosidase